MVASAYWGTKIRLQYGKKLLAMTPEKKKRWTNFMAHRNFYLMISVVVVAFLFFLWDGFVQTGGFLLAFVTIIGIVIVFSFLEDKIIN